MSKPVHDIRDGIAFDDLDVARCYVCRPPYPSALYEHLLSVTPGRAVALDVACGPGKIARELVPHFSSVVALDPSAPMLDVGRALKGGRASNIRWVCGRAEDFEIDGQCDLITIGTAVAWLRYEVVFPKCARWLRPEGLLAIISGDDGFEPPWSTEWRRFLTAWLARLGRQYDEAGFRGAGLSYVPWMDVVGDANFTFTFEQTIEDFVTCQHSRATWTRFRMGADMAVAFDAELREMLTPFAGSGLLRFRVRSTLVWGRPRTREK